MSNLVDCHIVDSGRNPQWLQECITSLESQPVNIHIIPYTKDLITSRRLGFSKGNAEFVTYADDDDVVDPNTINKCLDVLTSDKKPSAVYTDEYIVHEDLSICKPGVSWNKPWSIASQISIPTFVHPLIVARRSSVNKYLPMIKYSGIYPDYILWCMLGISEGFTHIDYLGYKWRQHEHQTTYLRSSTELILPHRLVMEYRRSFNMNNNIK